MDLDKALDRTRFEPKQPKWRCPMGKMIPASEAARIAGDIMSEALSRQNERYTYRDEKGSYTRWGLVERDIRSEIDKASTFFPTKRRIKRLEIADQLARELRHQIANNEWNAGILGRMLTRWLQFSTSDSYERPKSR
jgi:hypothetical protein